MFRIFGKTCVSAMALVLSLSAPAVAQTSDSPVDAMIASQLAQLPAPAKDSWPQISEEIIDAQLAAIEQRIAALDAAIDPATLSPAQWRKFTIYREALNYSLVEGRLKKQAYFISGNIYQDASWLANRLTQGPAFETAEDTENWLSLLDGLPAALAQHEHIAEERRARGVVMMDYMYPRTAQSFRRFASGEPCGEEGENPLRAAFIRKLDGLDEAARAGLQARADALLQQSVCPAYAGLADRVAAIEPEGRTEGYWNFAGGKEAYAKLAVLSLGEQVDPHEVHVVGLIEVARRQGEVLAEARALGFDGDLADLLPWLNERQSLPNTEDGRQALLDQTEALYADMRERLPVAFHELADDELVVDMRDTGRSAGVSGQYHSASEDGLRPATFELVIPAEGPIATWGLANLAYHEGIPGHHMQNVLATQAERIETGVGYAFYPAYLEGWAVYSTQLAEELGGYPTPEDKLGWHYYALQLAGRLVVDTGVNYEGWTKEQALAWQSINLGEEAGTGRFLNWPTQALGYYWGYVHISRLRAHAEQKLGDKFDLPSFHDLVLRNGSVPFSIVDNEVEQWIVRELEAEQ